MKRCTKCGVELYPEYEYDYVKFELHWRKRCWYCNIVFCEETIEKYYELDHDYIKRILEHAYKD